MSAGVVELADASTFTTVEIAEIFMRSFEKYFVPMVMDEPILKGMIYRDGISLNLSSIIMVEGKPQGLILISNRGKVDRVAAMGIAVQCRGKGVGKYALSRVKAKSAELGREMMVLEVIGQNVAAIKLYEGLGFVKVRRLLKLELKHVGQTPSAHFEKVQPCSLQDVAGVIVECGFENLPWQADSITLPRSGTLGFRLGDAFCALSDPNADVVNIRAFIVKQDSRRKGCGRALMEALKREYPGKTWRLNAIFPEEIAPFFERLGFGIEELFQYQMEARLK